MYSFTGFIDCSYHTYISFILTRDGSVKTWHCYLLFISFVFLDQVILKHLYIETTVQKDFAQNSMFWKINDLSVFAHG